MCAGIQTKKYFSAIRIAPRIAPVPTFMMVIYTDSSQKNNTNWLGQYMDLSLKADSRHCVICALYMVQSRASMKFIGSHVINVQG